MEGLYKPVMPGHSRRHERFNSIVLAFPVSQLMTDELRAVTHTQDLPPRTAAKFSGRSITAVVVIDRTIWKTTMFTGELVDHAADLKRLCPGSRYHTGSPAPTRAPDTLLDACGVLARSKRRRLKALRAKTRTPSWYHR